MIGLALSELPISAAILPGTGKLATDVKPVLYNWPAAARPAVTKATEL